MVVMVVMIVVMIGVMIMMVKGCGSIRTPSFRAGRFQVRALAPSHLDLTLDTMEMMMMMMMAVVVVVVVVVVPQEPQLAEEHCKQGSFVNSSRCEGGRGMNSFSP